MDNSISIYTLSDPITREIRYVGKTTKSLEWRLKKHMSKSSNCHYAKNWIDSLRVIGAMPEIELLESVAESDWQESERFWINYLRFIGCRLTNLLSGGLSGASHSIETKSKMSATRKGRKYSPEHCAAISDAKKGNTVITPEWRANMRKAKIGYIPKFTLEQKQKGWDKLKGRKLPASVCRKIGAALIGHIPWNKGGHLSDEHRDNLSKSHRGLVPWNKGKITGPRKKKQS